MTKRTFVLFFSLAYTLALLLLPGRSEASLRVRFSPYTVYETQDVDICPDEYLEIIPIVRADDFEWKENLSDLLRHRHSTYRFTLFAAVQSAFLDFVINSKEFFRSLIAIPFPKRVAILPDYYSFLHRLCPF